MHNTLCEDATAQVKEALEEAKKKHKINVRRNISQEQVQLLNSLYPERHIDTDGSSRGTHNMAAASRKIETDIILSWFPTGAWIFDIGGNWATHACRRDERKIHCCCPILDYRDAQRKTTRVLRIEKLVEEINMVTSTGRKIQRILEDEEIISSNIKAGKFNSEDMNGMWYCQNKFENCVFKPEGRAYAMAIHSIYDIDLHELVDALEEKEIKLMYGTFLFNVDMLLGKQSGVMKSFDGMYRIEGEYVKYWFGDDPNCGYKHNLQNLLKYITKTFVKAKGGSVYYLELKEQRGDVMFFTLTDATEASRCGITEDESFKCLPLDYKNKVIFPLFNLDEKTGELKFEEEIYPLDFVNRILEYTGRLKENQLNFQHLMTYLASTNNAIVINGNSRSQVNTKVDPQVLMGISTTLIVHSEVQRRQQEAVLKELRLRVKENVDIKDVFTHTMSKLFGKQKFCQKYAKMFANWLNYAHGENLVSLKAVPMYIEVQDRLSIWMRAARQSNTFAITYEEVDLQIRKYEEFEREKKRVASQMVKDRLVAKNLNGDVFSVLSAITEDVSDDVDETLEEVQAYSEQEPKEGEISGVFVQKWINGEVSWSKSEKEVNYSWVDKALSCFLPDYRFSEVYRSDLITEGLSENESVSQVNDTSVDISQITETIAEEEELDIIIDLRIVTAKACDDNDDEDIIDMFLNDLEYTTDDFEENAADNFVGAFDNIIQLAEEEEKAMENINLDGAEFKSVSTASNEDVAEPLIEIQIPVLPIISEEQCDDSKRKANAEDVSVVTAVADVLSTSSICSEDVQNIEDEPESSGLKMSWASDEEIESSLIELPEILDMTVCYGRLAAKPKYADSESRVERAKKEYLWYLHCKFVSDKSSMFDIIRDFVIGMYWTKQCAMPKDAVFLDYRENDYGQWFLGKEPLRLGHAYGVSFSLKTDCELGFPHNVLDCQIIPLSWEKDKKGYILSDRPCSKKKNSLLMMCDTTYLMNEMIIYQNCMRVLKTRKTKRKARITLIDGVPGCGKSTYIVNNADVRTDLILSMGKEATEDLKRRFTKEKGARQEDMKRVRTVDSYLLNDFGNKLRADTVHFDEALMAHAGMVYFIAMMCSAKRIKCQGDSKQIPFINRVESIKLEYAKLDIHETIAKRLTYRSPLDVAYYLTKKGFYGLDFITSANPLLRSMKTVGPRSSTPMSSIYVIPKTKGASYLTFTQTEKDEMKQYLGSGDWTVNTVHEAQGKTFNDVILVRLKNTENEIYPGGRNSEPYMVTGISRHKRSLIYYTRAEDKLWSDITDMMEVMDGKLQKHLYEEGPK
ncbi:150KDa protein [Broad bean necrosis virus]|nr:150KDa protein [Broad bean necrosis virus]BAA34693.1 150KDa protein [Broad bean necrosis virus]